MDLFHDADASDSWRQIEALFTAALDHPPHERAAFLARNCSSPALRAEVEALLSASEMAGDFLHRLDADRAALLLGEGEDSAGHPPGTRVGPYRILRELGYGGMGMVYLAERAAGEAKAQFEQRVALKLIRRGMDSEEILRRFLHERQILARLHHPNIARLLDGGVTRDDRPYFAMEYVEGAPLTDYCDAKRLGVNARLRLFQDVVAAVVYAHRNLIVHRDLKPSNILVTEDRVGRPCVKLLDFGIAKVLSEDDAPAGGTLTEAGRRVMTPEYAAPEQVRGEAITTATDVYALGVVLYELLTGHRPHRFAHRTPHEVARLVLEAEPEAPSTAVRRAGEVPSGRGTTETATPEQISAARSTQPERLRRRLSGDLDTIVLKALRKEPERLASAEAFLEDLQRHLARLPVKARKDSLPYRAHTFIRRHSVSVAAAALVLVALTAGLAVALGQARVAAREARKAQEVTGFLVSLFTASNPVIEAKGDAVTARELLQRGVARIEEELTGQPEVQAEMLDIIGTIYLELARFDQADSLLRQVLDLRRQTLGANHPDYALSLYSLGTLMRRRGDYAAAESLYQEALTLQRKLRGPVHPDVAVSVNGLAVVLYHKGDYAASERRYREALAMYRQIHGDEHVDVLSVMNNLAVLAASQGDYPAAEPLYRDVLALRRRLLGEEHVHVALSVNNLAGVLYDLGDYHAADSLFRQALAMRRKLLGAAHPDVAITLIGLARVHAKRNDYAMAESLSTEALAMQRTLLGDEHPDVARSLDNLAMVLTDKGDPTAALPLHEEALALHRRLLGPDHPRVAASMNGQALALHALGRSEEALVLLHEALRINRHQLGQTHPKVANTLD